MLDGGWWVKALGIWLIVSFTLGLVWTMLNWHDDKGQDDDYE